VNQYKREPEVPAFPTFGLYACHLCDKKWAASGSDMVGHRETSMENGTVRHNCQDGERGYVRITKAWRNISDEEVESLRSLYSTYGQQQHQYTLDLGSGGI